MTLEDLLAGVFIYYGQIVDAATVRDPESATAGPIKRGQPTCFVTAEIPYPSDQSASDLKTFAGYQSIVLRASVETKPTDQISVEAVGGKPGSCILWQLDKAGAGFLERVLSFTAGLKPHPDRILLRLSLKENFIWSSQAKKLFEKLTPGGFLAALRVPADLASPPKSACPMRKTRPRHSPQPHEPVPGIAHKAESATPANLRHYQALFQRRGHMDFSGTPPVKVRSRHSGHECIIRIFRCLLRAQTRAMSFSEFFSSRVVNE